MDRTPSRPIRHGAYFLASVLAAGLLLLPTLATAQPRYRVVNLGTLIPETTSGDGFGINSTGKVAGSSSNIAGSPAFKAVVADEQGMTALESAVGGNVSRAMGINDSNQSVGWERAPGVTDNRRARLWNGTVPTQLSSLPQHNNARALDINASGVAVGQSTPGATGGNGSRAVIWNGTTTPTDLGTLGGEQSQANAINDAGQVVGFSYLGDGSLRAALWQNGTIVNLGSGGNFSYATAINNKGQIVGSSTGPFNPRAYLWQNGTMTNLGTIGGGDSVANDINEQGLIIGEYNLLAGGTRGAIWYMGEMFDVNTLLHPSSAGWTVETLQNVNDAGQIAGRACFAGVGCRAVRLEPIFSQYLAEGATSNFFDTQLALLNPGDRPTTATLTFLAGATTVQTQVAIPARTRATVNPKTVQGLAAAEFSTVVESDALLIVDRTMSWDATGYGAHAETAVSSPSTTWYLAEGATIGGFNLFYLLQNPSSQTTRVRVRYLRTTGAPLEKEYDLPPNSRTNIWVNVEEFPGLGMALASAEFSAVVESTDNTPIIVERAMYLSNQGRTFNAGHESMGITTPNTQWFLAEGATGPYFDLFVLVANPTANDANVTVTYLLGDGRTFSRDLVAPANQRSGIWVDVEQFDGVPGFPLADVAVSTRVASTNNVPLIVERAMWWPGDSSTWQEAHNSAGSRRTGVRWALAEGEVGGARNTATYVLVANTSAFAGEAAVTLLFEDGSSAQKTYPLPANSRTNVPVADDFPQARGRRFGAIIESTGTTPAQIVVERAMYSDAGGVTWAAGTNSLATRIP